jgi:signal transduction histidine kinase
MNGAVERSRARLLAAQTRWLMNLRWLAAGCVFSAGLVNWLWLRAYEVGAGPVVLAVVIAAVNVCLWAYMRSRPDLSQRGSSLLLFASIQIHFDLACLTLLAVWTGGLASPFLGAFLFHMLFASLLQPRGRAYAVAGAAVVALAAGLWVSGQWPRTVHERVLGVAWAGTLFVSVHLTDRVSRALYRREVARDRRLEKLRRLSAQLRAQQAAIVQSEKMAAMGQMAAGITHEITNPLASMDSLLQLMERHPNTPRPEAVATLREQIQRILRIVRQFTSYAHPGMNQRGAVSVNDLVKSAVGLFEFNRRMERAKLECDLQDSAGAVRVDAQALQQVLTNLLVNALDAVQETPHPRLVVRTRREHDRCVIEVSDNGMGIPPENLPRIFEPFFTTKPVGKGTGLGLSICARLVREENGTISVRSRPGEGAVFLVSLPAIEDPEERRTSAEAPGAEPVGSKSS